MSGVLSGQIQVDVQLPDGGWEMVAVREVTAWEVLYGNYVELLQSDYAGALELTTGKSREWLQALPRHSWVALREAEERLNFSFALAEVKAAHDRGEKLRFIQEQQAKILQLLRGSILGSASSATTQSPQDAPSPRSKSSSATGSAGYRVSSSAGAPVKPSDI